jgi:pimeloyl-ACP methyl ester carboxylesterase
MFSDYVTPAEQSQQWLAGRSIYAYSFPNRRDNPRVPPFYRLVSGVIAKEFDENMDALAKNSPTGKLVVVAHDWGATHTWRWIRNQHDAPVEKLVALSVGSSFRYDVYEHGLNVFSWLSGLWFSLGWYLPFMRPILTASLVRYGGYRSATAAELWRDAYHYWDRPMLLLTFIPRALMPPFASEYTDFHFPVLYLRSPMDRIASTAAFEQRLATGGRKVVMAGNHWFPEQHSADVIAELRAFLR